MRKLVLGLALAFGLFGLIWGVNSYPNGGMDSYPNPVLTSGGGIGDVASGIYFGGETIPYKKKVSFSGQYASDYRQKISFGMQSGSLRASIGDPLY